MSQEARSAARDRPFAGQPAEVLYRLMLELDNHEDLDDHPIRKSAPYEAATHGLGWDIDWAEIVEQRASGGGRWRG